MLIKNSWTQCFTKFLPCTVSNITIVLIPTGSGKQSKPDPDKTGKGQILTCIIFNLSWQKIVFTFFPHLIKTNTTWKVGWLYRHELPALETRMCQNPLMTGLYEHLRKKLVKKINLYSCNFSTYLQVKACP